MFVLFATIDKAANEQVPKTGEASGAAFDSIGFLAVLGFVFTKKTR